jgi:UDP-N-acetylglucosamine--N-acetylmuramyl-(pentapeptide) pyrophosphoryl-undecaprenol N-acetylglucosamine transferase
MKLCITGGGTGGHLMIAASLVEAAIQDGHEVIFIGSTSGQDQRYFKEHSSFSHVYFLETSGVVNKKGVGKIKALFAIIKAFFQARKILKRHKIEATYSVGGFSAAAASFASLSRFIPLFIHEQNAVTGRLNALLRPFAKRFISAYDAASPIQGYPVGAIFVKTKRVRERLQTIIFLGGSQGARAINDLALSVAQVLQKKEIHIIHQCGEADFERVTNAYKELGVKAEVYGFTKEIPTLIARADLAVSRAGASTLWELCSNGLPALFIPYPYAAGDHQFYNAQFILQHNLGWCYREGEELRKHLLAILQEPLKEKSEALMQYAHKDVAHAMIEDVKKALHVS